MAVMTTPDSGCSVDELATWLAGRLPGDRRYLLGIAGPPAAGKSTLSERVARALTEKVDVTAQVAPMDGFHMTSQRLSAVGALERKGEPDTFDVDGFVAALTALRSARAGTVVGWPAFDRVLDDPVPAAITFAHHRVAVVEGNYLLLPNSGWSKVRDLLDEVWYLDAEDTVLEQRLLERHLAGGKGPDRASAKVAGSDMVNARLIATTRERADIVLRESNGAYVLVGRHI